MTKVRIIILSLTIIVVFGLSYFFLLYARGFRFDSQKAKIVPSGLLIVRSNPEGAQIFINQELKGTSNTNFNLVPNTYDLTVKKEGFTTWQKRVTVKKEEVTEVDAHLFKLVPSLSPVTFNSALNPIASDNSARIAFAVPATSQNRTEDKEGLWVLENINLPLGFSRDPKRITNSDLKDSNWIWSPTGREILLITPKGKFLLDATTYTPQEKRVNIAAKVDETLKEWQIEREKMLNSKLKSLPEKMTDFLSNYATNINFSPDETKILYTAKADFNLPDELIKPVPGASTQKQERTLKKGQTYVYDIKDDRNFFIAPQDDNLQVGNQPLLDEKENPRQVSQKLIWFSTSRHIIWAKEGKIIIADYDGTNQQEVYNGSYLAPAAFATAATDRILILTNLGADSQEANLYYLNLK